MFALPLSAPSPVVSSIPKNLHFIWWQGFEQLPKHFMPLLMSWKNAHPGWEIYLWDRAKVNALVETMPGTQPQQIKQFMGNYTYDIQRIDFARLLILKALGGVYCDVDLLCLRSIEPLLAGRDFYICREQEPFVSFCNAFLAAQAKHPAVEAMLQTLIHNQARQSDVSGGEGLMILNTTGPRILTPLMVALQGENQPGVCIDMDPATIYPVPWTRDPIPQDPDVLRQRYPNSYAVHMWAGSWHTLRKTPTPTPASAAAAPIRLTHGHVVNLARRPDRWQRFQNHLQQDLRWTMPLYRHDAVNTASWNADGSQDAGGAFRDYVVPNQVDVITRGFRTEHAHLTRGAVGCGLSHLHLWQLLEANPRWDHMLIFEDDALWKHSKKLSADEISASINAMGPDWDVVLLGGYPKEVLETHGWWLRVGFFHTTHAYVIRRSALPKLLGPFLPMREQLDHYMSRRIQEADLKVYMHSEQLFDQTWADTDVQTALVGSPSRTY